MSLAGLGAVALSPVLIAVSIRVWLDHDGPVLYRGVRAGVGGRPFTMYKFRSMVVDADRIGGSNTPSDDPRLTDIGRFLRKYKLDELPQLVNVVKGEMSIVGPRPQVLDEVARYSDHEQLLLTVKPGLTDWASIRFYNEGEILLGQADTDKAYAQLIRPEKIRLGLEYAQHATLKDDIRIVATTCWLLGRRLLAQRS